MFYSDIAQIFQCLIFIIFIISGSALGQGRIVDGSSAMPGEFPALVKLYISKADGYRIICAGTIIDPVHIITAAHCTHHPVNVNHAQYEHNFFFQYIFLLYAKKILAIANELPNWNTGASDVQKRFVVVNMVHPFFSNKPHAITNDIALLRV